jgi:hypothetical protein
MDTPEETYRAFHRALAEEDWDRAVTFLAPEIVERIRDMGARLAKLKGVDIDPLDYILQNASAKVPVLRSLKVASRQEGNVVLEISAEPCDKEGQCTVSRTTVRRHEGRWVLEPEVPTELHRPADPSGGEGE